MSKQAFKLWLIVCAMTAMLAGQELNATRDALELARHEQMLVSRMLKDIVLIASNYLHKERTIQELKKTKLEYTDGLKKLQVYETTPAWNEMMHVALNQWEKAQKLTTGEPDKKRAMEYIKGFAKLKLPWNKPIAYLMKQASEKPSDPITILSNFKIYSEQMTTMYLLRTWQLKDPTRVDKASHGIGKKVYQGFQILLASPQTTPEMQAVIQQMKKLSLYFKVMWDSTVRTPTIVVKKSQEAFDLAQKLLKMYKEKR
jgi:hypothetical protein